MFDFLMDALNGGESIHALNRLLRLSIRNAEVRASSASRSMAQVRPFGIPSLKQRLATSFSFDEVQPACELRFVSVVSRILQQQHPKSSPNHGPTSNGTSREERIGINELAVQQIVAFMEKAWFAMTVVLPDPLRTGGQCQQKPHEMFTWIKLIGIIATQALDQLSRTYQLCYAPNIAYPTSLGNQFPTSQTQASLTVNQKRCPWWLPVRVFVLIHPCVLAVTPRSTIDALWGLFADSVIWIFPIKLFKAVMSLHFTPCVLGHKP